MPAEAARIYAVVPQGLAAPGGMSRMAAYYVQDWQARGRTPDVRVIDSYGPRDRRLMPLHFARACLRILIDGLRGRIALLHLHMAEDGSTLRKSLLLLLGRALGVPVVVHMHGARFAQSCARLPHLLLWLLAGVLRGADLVLVLGAASQRFVVERLGLPPGRVVVLANAVPDPGPRHAADTGCRVLFLGALCPRKGLDVLLAALAHPALAGACWQADIAGNGDAAPWQAQAARLGIAHRLTWHGWQTPAQTQALLARASLLVLPSRQEGLPMVILEAMAHGLPVIATAVGDVPDAVTPDRTGLITPPDDVPALAEALAALIGDPARRRKLGQAARARYEQDFALDGFGTRLAGLLEQVVTRRRHASGLRALALLGSGAAAGQALVLLASPLLTRLYPAASFGGFGLFSGIVGVIGAVATLKYEQAILLEREPARAADALRLCLLLSLAAAALTPLAVWLTGQPRLHLVLVWGGPAVLAAGLVGALSAWATRQGRFRRLSLYQTARSGLAVALQLGAALVVAPGAALLVGGQVLGQGLAAGFLAADRHMLAALRGWRWSGLAAIARDHRHLALYGAPQTLGHLLSVSLPAILLPFCFGPVEAGMFWLAWRLLVLPSQIVTESMRGLLFREAAALAGQQEAARRAMRRATVRLGLLGLPVALVLLAAGPALFALVFGPHWRPAGVDAALMALPWWLETVAVPSSVTVVVLRLQRRYLAIELASLTARAAGLLLGAHLGSVTWAVALYAVAASASSLALMRLAAVARR